MVTDKKSTKTYRKEIEMIKKTRKTCLSVVAALLIALTGSATQSDAGVDVNVGDEGVDVNVGGQGVNINVGGIRINVGDNLPAVRFAAPPDLVVIPGTYVYMVPDIEMDVLFFQEYWWRSYEGHWYRSRDYNGQWKYAEPGEIPSGLRSLPQDYRQLLSPGYERIPYRDVEKHWKKWEREKYWDRRSEKGRGIQDGDRHDDRKDNDDHR